MLRVIPHPPQRSMFHGDRSPSYSQTKPVHPPYGNQFEKTQLTPQEISQIYKYCTNLFLTRRLPEALAALQPVVADSSASVWQSPRTLRIKFWGLYLAILDAAAKSSASEGKATWGSQEWPELVGKIKNGAVWDEVNRVYGDEGRVDAEVVVTLSTLLLSHCPDQTITQKKIESWLGAAPSAFSPDDDPKSMLQRARIIEIYVLHVLPRVEEWEYAREFAQMSPDIVDEKREQFYATLESLQKDMKEKELQTRELARQRDEELELGRIQELETRRSKSRAPSASSRTSRHRGSSVKSAERVSISKEDIDAEAIVKKRLAKAKETKKVSISRATGKTKDNKSLFSSASGLLARMQAHMLSTAGPFSMLQTVVMLAVIAWITKNKKMRDRIRRILIIFWIKMTKTIGMGMKVTYL